MDIKLKLFILFLVASFIPIFFIAYATVYLQIMTLSWLQQVLMIIGIMALIIAGIFAFFTSAIIVEPTLDTAKEKIQHALEESRIANDKLQQEKAKDEALLNNIGDAVVAVDTDRRVIFINRTAADMIGWRQQEVVGKHWGKDMPKVVGEQNEPVPMESRSIYTAWKTKKKAHVSHYYYIRKDGSKFPVSITSAPIITKNQITGAIVVFRDITREKEIDRMKTEFISLASHQLRTPLSAVKWYLRMLLDGDAGAVSPEQLEFLKIIDDSNERMISLVNDLLNISRIESGRIIIEPSPTSIATLIDSVVKELKMKVAGKDQSLTIEIDKDLPLISIDGQLIRHVYLNLLSNAIKYTPKAGHVKLRVYRNNDIIISQISDDGYGIPKDQQSKVFQKFFRAENIIKYETDGTGLGLYLAKSIVESSGGKMWFESPTFATFSLHERGSGEVNPAGKKGTTFWFTLPVAGMKPKEGKVTLDS